MDIREAKRGKKDYLCLTDVVNYLRLKDVNLNLSLAIKSYPSDWFLKVGRGRNGSTYINKDYVEYFFSRKRNIPKEYINQVFESVAMRSVGITNTHLERAFFDILDSFLKELLPNTSIKYQYSLEGFCFDSIINDKLIIEFDEYQHQTDVVKTNDLNKEISAKNNNKELIRINSKDNYGKSCAIVYKTVKKIFY